MVFNHNEILFMCVPSKLCIASGISLHPRLVSGCRLEVNDILLCCLNSHCERTHTDIYIHGTATINGNKNDGCYCRCTPQVSAGMEGACCYSFYTNDVRVLHICVCVCVRFRAVVCAFVWSAPRAAYSVMRGVYVVLVFESIHQIVCGGKNCSALEVLCIGVHVVTMYVYVWLCNRLGVTVCCLIWIEYMLRKRRLKILC